MITKLLTSKDKVVASYSPLELYSDFSIIPIVLDEADNLQAIQPWNPETEEPWESKEAALAWAVSWINSEVLPPISIDGPNQEDQSIDLPTE